MYLLLDVVIAISWWLSKRRWTKQYSVWTSWMKNVVEIGHLFGFRWDEWNIDRIESSTFVFKFPTKVNKTWKERLIDTQKKTNAKHRTHTNWGKSMRSNDVGLPLFVGHWQLGKRQLSLVQVLLWPDMNENVRKHKK